MNRNEIQIRDPFILPVPIEGKYYLYGTTDKNPWNSQGEGFDAYKSDDLENWEGPFPVFRPESDFWGTHDFWAPEVHVYKNHYYMFATFISSSQSRGTQILQSDNPLGPFKPLVNHAVTPVDWQCLDGTLYIDEFENPWIIFCHEWVQVSDGEICALQLSPDLCHSIGEPILLFRGSEALWTKALPRRDDSSIVDARVTDGPFIHRNSEGGLLLLWSSLGETGYCQGSTWSESGSLAGPWIQNPTPILTSDGGHGMIFRSFDNRLYITYHSPNSTPLERFFYVEIEERGSKLFIKNKQGKYNGNR